MGVEDAPFSRAAALLANNFHVLVLPQVNDVPFEQLEALRQDGRFSVDALKLQQRGPKDRGKAHSFKRDNKNRPMEASSKRPVPRLREVVQAVKRWVFRGQVEHGCIDMHALH